MSTTEKRHTIIDMRERPISISRYGDRYRKSETKISDNSPPGAPEGSRLAGTMRLEMLRAASELRLTCAQLGNPFGTYCYSSFNLCAPRK